MSLVLETTSHISSTIVFNTIEVVIESRIKFVCVKRGLGWFSAAYTMEYIDGFIELDSIVIYSSVIFKHVRGVNDFDVILGRGGSRGRVQGVRTPPLR